LFTVLTSRVWLRLAASLLRVYQRSGLARLARGLGLIARLPERLRALEALAPQPRPRLELAAHTPAQPPRRRRVGVLLGCVQRELFSNLNAATVRVLAAEGCEVVAPAAQGCCGALLLHAGEEARAQAHARRMIDVFEHEPLDAIVVNAAGCGSNLKQYGHLLRDDPAYRERARDFADRCRDVSEFLQELGLRSPLHPLPLRVAMHDACHLRHAQGIHEQPRALLRAVPALSLSELPEPSLCCGSAGIYNLVQPAAAGELADRKAEHIAAAAPDVVATGNIGCILQLSAALRRAGQPTRVVHTLELLDAAIRGAPLPEE
jgi:glycolate oxidase iron-sulfur subunit